jgi:hypothetical protein
MALTIQIVALQQCRRPSRGDRFRLALAAERDRG